MFFKSTYSRTLSTLVIITIGPLTRVGVGEGAKVGLFVGVGTGVSVGRGVGDGFAVAVGQRVGESPIVGRSITVGISEGTGECVGEGVYVGNKPASRIAVSIIAAVKHPQQQRAMARGIKGKAIFLPVMVGLIFIESVFFSKDIFHLFTCAEY